MSSLEQCHDLLSSAKRVVRLSIDLVGNEAERLPDRLARVLNSREVQKALGQALEAAGRELLEEQLKAAKAGKPLPLAPESEKVARAIGKGVYNAAPAEYLKLIKNSAQVKELESAFDAVLRDFNCTPFGAWVEDNRKVLIVVGTVLALGTATAFYLTRTGDMLTAPLAGISKEIKVGSLSLEPQLIEFTPSKQFGSAKVAIKYGDVGKFSVTGTASEGKFGVAMSSEVTFRLAKPLTLSLGSDFALTGIAPANAARSQWLAGPWNSYVQHHTYSTLAWKDGGLVLSGSALVRNEAPGLAFGATYRSTTPMGLLSVGGKAEVTTEAAAIQSKVSLSPSSGTGLLEFNASFDGAHHFGRQGPAGLRALDPAVPPDEFKGTLNLLIYLDAPPKKK